MEYDLTCLYTFVLAVGVGHIFVDLEVCELLEPAGNFLNIVHQLLILFSDPVVNCFYVGHISTATLFDIGMIIVAEI